MAIDHLTDDQLVRRVDGELELDEADVVERHLAGCIPCRREVAEIEALSRRFSAAVTLVDPPAHGRTASGRRTFSPAWRVAAAIALTAGIGLALPPVRGWVAERLGLGSAPVAESPLENDEGTSTSLAEAGLRVAFVPEGDRFVVRVSNPQAVGRLTLGAVSGEEAVAEIGGANEDAEILVLPDGFAIRNRPSARADYHVDVPPTISGIEVRLGDRVAWTGSVERLRASPVTLPLEDVGSAED